MVLFIVLFLICFIGYYLHTLWHYQQYKGIGFKQRGKLFNVYTHIIVFAGYLAYGFMIYTDPFKIDINLTMRISGLIVGIAGIIIVALATIKKKGYTEPDSLIESGIYSIMRNPMYFGIILIHIGLPLFFGSIITLLSAFIWIPLIILWKHWEEKCLERKFGEKYIAYKRRTLF